MKNIGKKYCFIRRADYIVIYTILEIIKGTPITYTFKTSGEHISHFQVGSSMDKDSFEIDDETNLNNVRDKYPELFL